LHELHKTTDNCAASRTITVPESETGRRLDQFLSKILSSLSRARIQRTIESGNVTVNNHSAQKNRRLKTGDIVTVREDEFTFARETPDLAPEDIALDVLYQDEYLLGINKPSGLVVHPGSGNRSGTMVNALLHSFPGLSDGYESNRPGIVHRLDKYTTGVLVVARNNAVHAALGLQFANRTVEKTYAGICIGRMPEENGRIEAPLGRSRSDPLKRAVIRHGKPALTEYRLKAYQSGISLLEFILHTGRTHQIRVHAAHSGFPILADDTYGGGRECILRQPPLERPFAYRILKCFDRHALHSRTLAFMHPVTNERIEITAPYPPDFKQALSYLAPEG